MADITKKIIEIDPGNSLKTMKQLRDETNAYREALLNLDEGSEEYVQIAKQIADNQAKLNSVMSAGKKYTDDAAGSYNALQAELTKLRAEWKATGDEMERAQLALRMNELNDQLKDMDASVGNFQRNVGNYTSVWGGLADAIGDVSRIGKDASEGFEGLGKTLNLAGAAGEAFNNSLNRSKAIFKIGEAIGKVTQGLKQYIAASVAAAKAERQRAAAEKEAAVATNTATVATKAATIATRAFGVALKSIGIGLVISLVAALVANMDRLKKSFAPLISRFEEFGKKVKNVLREIVAAFVGVGTAVAEVASHLNDIWVVAVDNFKTIWSGVFDWFAARLKTMGEAFELLQKPGGLVAAATTLVAGWKKADEDIAGAAKSITTNLKDLFNNKIDLKGAFKQGQEAGRAFFDGLSKKIKKEGPGSKDEIKIPVVIDLSKLTVDDAKLDAALNKDAKDKLADRLAELYKQDFAQQLIDLETERDEVLAVFEGTEEQKLALIQLYGEKEAELREKINSQISQDLEENIKQQVEMEKEAIKAAQKRKEQQISVYDYIGDTLGNLSDLFEEDTIAYKALATSQALISTFLAGTRVMAEEMGPWYVKVAAMAAVITAGLASVAKIVSVNPKGENGSVSVSAPQTAAAVPVVSNTPSISYTRQLTTAQEEDEMNRPIWCSIVDIENMRNKVRVREENATF